MDERSARGMNYKVTVIGAGRMGSALATVLFHKGFATTVWNRTGAKAEVLSRLGLSVAQSVEESVREADIVVVSLSDYSSTRQLLQQPDIETALRGKIVVQLSSGTPKEAREMDCWARRCGIPYLDGAILGSPAWIGTPAATIFYSGPAEVFNRAQPVLTAFGERTVFVGHEIGHASAFDVAVLTFGVSAISGDDQRDDANHGISLHRHVAESFVKKLRRRSSFARSVFRGHQAACKLVPRSRFGPHYS